MPNVTVNPPSTIKVEVGSQTGGAVQTISYLPTTLRSATDLTIGSANTGDVITYNSVTGNFTVLPASGSDKSAANTANAAFARANAAYGQANSAAAFANGAFTIANSAYVSATNFGGQIPGVYAQANAAFNQANSAASFANSAFAAANAAGSSSNVVSAFAQANSAASFANSSFLVANSAASFANGAFVAANSGASFANSAFLVANSAASFANGAFAQANVSFGQANSSASFANSAYTKANSAGSYSNSAFLVANSTAIFANAAFDKANSAGSFANGAFVSANSGAIFANAAFVTANSAATFANAAFTTANSGASFANSAFTLANNEPKGTSAGVFANAAFTTANSGASFANAAFLTANTALLYNTAITDTVTSIAVGGAPAQAASIWKTYTMVQALDTILFPTLGPSYTIPTLSLSANNTGTLEIGTPINQSLTVTGNKNDAGPFTQLRVTRNGNIINLNTSPTITAIANIAAQYGFADPNNQNYSYANTYVEANTIAAGTTTWQGYGNYNAGLSKLNNKGATDSNTAAVLLTTNPQAANAVSFASGTAVITGIYPYFWGVSSTAPTAASIATAIAAGTQNKVLAVGSGTLTITYNAASQYIWLAVQTGYAAKTTWYNTALNNGSIGAGQFILSPVSQAVNSPNSYWTGVTYNIYISGYATTTSGSIQFS